MMIWAARLSGFLLFRIIKTGKDDRFDDKRDKFFPFLGFWVFQMIWVWTVSLPVTVLNSPNVTKYRQPAFGTGLDVAGVVLWTLGFVVESVSDVQKYRFRSNPANKGRTCTVGLFSWTRHPNYFGEIVVQFSIFMLALSPSAYNYAPRHSGASAAQYSAILSPIFLTSLLLFVSGLPLQERSGAKKKYSVDGARDGPVWTEYRTWTERTSILLPLPPQVYAPLPRWIKRAILLEWPMYVFDPRKHADDGDKTKVVEDEEDGRGRRQGHGGEESEVRNGSGDGLMSGNS